MTVRKSDNKICQRCGEKYTGWIASKYCGPKCRILAMSEVAPNGCWVWQGRVRGDGRGVLNYNNTSVSAPRTAYTAWRGPIEAGKLVCHSCDNPACVNPDHLWLGTPADNAKDCVAKNRQAKGDNHPPAKLTASIVAELRASPLGCRKLARKYGVSRTTIMRARSGKNWSHVP